MGDESGIIDYSILDENSDKIKVGSYYRLSLIDCPVKKETMILQSH